MTPVPVARLIEKWRSEAMQKSGGRAYRATICLRSCADELEALLAEQEQQPGWRPIATAPKTGEHILVAEFNPERIGFGFCGGKKQSMMTVAHWWDNPGEEGWYASVDSQGETPFPATHWKPLEEIET